MYLPFAVINLTPFLFDVRICCELRSIVTYVNIPIASTHKTNEQLQATSQGQFYLVQM